MLTTVDLSTLLILITVGAFINGFVIGVLAMVVRMLFRGERRI
jgi:uncharacterized integral membrane protein